MTLELIQSHFCDSMDQSLNAVLGQIHEHRSIRKFKSQPVSDKKITRILEAATRASSSGNMQPYSIIVTSDEKLRSKLHKAHFHQDLVLEAPHLITFCADFNRMRQWLKISGAPMNFDNVFSFFIGLIDATLAAQTAAIAAESEGLGLCFLGTTLANTQTIGEILRTPDHVIPVVGFALGYANESPAKRDRLPLGGVIHQETYQLPTEEEIQSIYQKKESMGFDRYMSHPELKKKVLEKGAKNLAQVYTKVKYTEKSHIDYTNNVFNYLKKKGFQK